MLYKSSWYKKLHGTYVFNNYDTRTGAHYLAMICQYVAKIIVSYLLKRLERKVRKSSDEGRF